MSRLVYLVVLPVFLVSCGAGGTGKGTAIMAVTDSSSPVTKPSTLTTTFSSTSTELNKLTMTATPIPSVESIGFLVGVASRGANNASPPEKATSATGPTSSAETPHADTWDSPEMTSVADNFTPSLVFEPAPQSRTIVLNVPKSEPRIVEITTHVTEPGSGVLSGPHIDGIEAHLEEPSGVGVVGAVHRIPTAIEEKLEGLSCDVPPLPSQSVLWNGNQTRDLALPIMVRSFNLFKKSRHLWS